MSKAQEKRNQVFRSTLTRRLIVLFNPFRNYNYKSYVDSKINPHKTLLESHWGTYSDSSEAFEALEGKTFKELGLDRHISKYKRGGSGYKTREEITIEKEQLLQEPITSGSQLYSKMGQVKSSRNIMGMVEIHRLTWLQEVKESFDGRFNKMVDSMCNGMEPKKSDFKIEVEELSNSWNEFSVLIHVEDTTFHARAIWVVGTQVTSHYRFITTTRKRK
tara:strand:- start:935 stop:1588 length:654 start_codon:yes stop_codon:yes gene_type:complete